MSDVHPFVYPPEERVDNSTAFKKGDMVRISTAPWNIERYSITEVIGSEDVAQYAVIGMSTGERFAYFGAEEMVAA